MAGHMPTCTHPAAAGHLGIAQNTPAVAGEMSGMGGKMAEGRKDGRGEGVCEASAASGCLREARPSADPKALISGFNFTTWWQLTSLWCPQCIFFFATSCGMQDLSSPTRDQAHALCNESSES